MRTFRPKQSSREAGSCAFRPLVRGARRSCTPSATTSSNKNHASVVRKIAKEHGGAHARFRGQLSSSGVNFEPRGKEQRVSLSSVQADRCNRRLHKVVNHKLSGIEERVVRLIRGRVPDVLKPQRRCR